MNAETLPKYRRWAAFAGIGGVLICLIGGFVARQPAFQAYWIAWLFWGGVGLGAIPILAMSYLAPGVWGQAVRPFAEAAALTLPLAVILFIPALLGLSEIFPWHRPDFFAGHDWPHKHTWLTSTGFILRSALCLGLLLATARSIIRRPDRPQSFAPRSSVALIVYFTAVLVASTDWIMSLVPEWTSTMLPVIAMAGQFLSALAWSVLMAMVTTPRGAFTPKCLNDLGNLLLAFVIFWAYVSFSQFLIIWSGNLPREIAWYLPLRSGGWPYVTGALALFNFGVPFSLLLSRAAKRNEQRLAPIAALIFAASALHVFWLTAPAFHPHQLRADWLNAAAFIGLGGMWIAVFLTHLQRRLLLFPRDESKEVTHG